MWQVMWVGIKSTDCRGELALMRRFEENWVLQWGVCLSKKDFFSWHHCRTDPTHPSSSDCLIKNTKVSRKKKKEFNLRAWEINTSKPTVFVRPEAQLKVDFSYSLACAQKLIFFCTFLSSPASLFSPFPLPWEKKDLKFITENKTLKQVQMQCKGRGGIKARSNRKSINFSGIATREKTRPARWPSVTWKVDQMSGN